MARGCGGWGHPPPPHLFGPWPGFAGHKGLPQAQAGCLVLGILLRPLRPASQLPAGGASSPGPAWAMHYPRKIEDLMEAISTRGSHSIQALEGVLVGSFSHPEIGVHLEVGRGAWN